jgi:hypothetical protein
LDKNQILYHNDIKEKVGFTILKKVEKKYFKNKIPDFNEFYRTWFIDKIENLKIFNIDSSDLEDSISTLKELDIEFIINFINTIHFEENLINISNKGIFSFNFCNHKFPNDFSSIFKNVYKNKKSLSIEVLLKSNNASGTLLLGKFPTQRTYTESLLFLQRESLFYVINFIKKNITTAKAELNFQFTALSKRQNTFIEGRNWQYFHYLFSTAFNIVKFKYKSINKNNKWSVAYLPKSDFLNVDFSKGTIIKNPEGRFLADPFIVTKEDRTICFVEDYDFKQNIGSISAIEIFNNKSYQFLGEVIKEEFHMSFPYLFEYENELYMIPETSQANSIRLYKCINFPLKWDFQWDLISNIKTVDTMIFNTGKQWCLLTNEVKENGTDANSSLFAYFSDSPLSQNWTPHENNPIVLNSEFSRNGGILKKDSILYRIRQQHGGKNLYGHSFSIAKILELSNSSFKEEQIQNIEPVFFRNLLGCHTMNENENYFVYDFYKFESILS